MWLTIDNGRPTNSMPLQLSMQPFKYQEKDETIRWVMYILYELIVSRTYNLGSDPDNSFMNRSGFLSLWSSIEKTTFPNIYIIQTQDFI